MLQFEAVRSVTGLGEAPCDIFIIVFQMEDDEVERGADYFRIETFRPCGDADIQKCVVVFGNAVLENGMGGVQLLQETDESFTGGACRRDTQMDAEQGIHVFFEDAGFYVFAGIEINYFCHGASCAGFHISFIILWVHIKMKKYIISLIREQILSVPWYNNKSDYGTAIFIFYVINEMYGYN